MLLSLQGTSQSVSILKSQEINLPCRQQRALKIRLLLNSPQILCPCFIESDMFWTLFWLQPPHVLYWFPAIDIWLLKHNGHFQFKFNKFIVKYLGATYFYMFKKKKRCVGKFASCFKRKEFYVYCQNVPDSLKQLDIWLASMFRSSTIRLLMLIPDILLLIFLSYKNVSTVWLQLMSCDLAQDLLIHWEIHLQPTLLQIVLPVCKCHCKYYSIKGSSEKKKNTVIKLFHHISITKMIDMTSPIR